MDANLVVDIFENGSSVPDQTYTEIIDAFVFIDYPLDGVYGGNILQGEDLNISGGAYSMAVFSPKKITVRLTGTGWNVPDPPQSMNWTVSPYNNSTGSQIFVFNGDQDGDFLLNIEQPAQGTNEIGVELFEGCAVEPTYEYSLLVN